MVELKDIAKKIENILNTNTLGKTFRIFSDSGELAKRNGHENEYRNGLVEIVSSTISNLSGLQFINMSVNFTLYANEEARGKDSDGNSLEIIELRQILGDFLDSYNFKTFAEEFGEATYSTTYVIGATTTLPKGNLGYINDCVPLVTNIGLTFFENGVNSNEWQIFIDGEEVGYTSAVISRTKTAENQPLVESKSTKSVMQTNGFGLDLVVPQISNNLGNAIENEILTGQEYAHMLYIKGKNTEQNYICVFGNLQASLIKNANVGFNVPLVEGVPELLEYEEYKWLELEKEVTDLSYNTVTILNNDSENLYIIWGDGSTTTSNFEEIQHTYSALGTYTITLYNKDATDEDWADAIIRDYLELDKFDYTILDDNKIRINKVNAPATTYKINGTYYINNEVNTVTEIGGGTSSTSGIVDANAVDVTIPNTIKSINANAFYVTPSLVNINFPNSLEDIGNGAFRGCSLTNVDLSNTLLTEINSSVFMDNSDLETISLPSSITLIGNGAFQGCTSLQSISLPGGLKSIQANAFSGSGLTSIFIPSSVETIISRAFNFCNNLSSITVSEESLYWQSQSNNRMLLNKTGTSLMQYALASPTISVTIPDTVVNIDFYAFYGANNLTTVTIPDNGMSSMNILSFAFANCESLSTLSVQNPIPPTLYPNVFSNTPLTTINVPSASLSAYQTASGWSDYASIMVGV